MVRLMHLIFGPAYIGTSAFKKNIQHQVCLYQAISSSKIYGTIAAFVTCCEQRKRVAKSNQYGFHQRLTE